MIFLLILFTIIFGLEVFGQGRKSVLNEALKDSIGAIISDSVSVFRTVDDSLASDITNLVDKSSVQTITGEKKFTADTTKFASDSSVMIYQGDLRIEKAEPYGFIRLVRKNQLGQDRILQIDNDLGAFVLTPYVEEAGAGGGGTPGATVTIEGAKIDGTGNQVYDWGLSSDRFATTSVLFRFMNEAQDDYIPLVVKAITINGDTASHIAQISVDSTLSIASSLNQYDKTLKVGYFELMGDQLKLESIPSDSTGLATGRIYYDNNGFIKRKF